MDNIFSLQINYETFKKMQQKNGRSPAMVINYIWSFFLPEKQYMELEDVVDVEDGKKALGTYNEYIYYLNLHKLLLLELEDNKRTLEKLRLIHRSMSIYDEIAKKEQDIRKLDSQIDNLGMQLLTLKQNFSQHCFQLFLLPQGEEESSFILPLMAFNIKKIFYYVNYSSPVQKAYYTLKEVNENIASNFSLKYRIVKGMKDGMRMNYEPHLHMDEIVHIKYLSHTLQVTYYRTFLRVKSAYFNLLLLKDTITYAEQHLNFIHGKINDLLLKQDIQFLLEALHLKKQIWNIRKKILYIQWKQSEYTGELMVNLVPLNRIKYTYYYKIFPNILDNNEQ